MIRDLRKLTVLALCGPTCTGKTALGLALALEYDLEIVGADSRQIYRGMSVGTAAPSDAERARVPHHLVGFLDPFERYSAARFVSGALRAIDDVVARGKRPLVVGGTGFYIRALAGDVELSAAFDENTRARLVVEARVHSSQTLHAWLAVRAPQRAVAIDPQDRYRVLRALEIALAGNATAEDAPRDSLRERGLELRKLVLDIPDDVRDARIATRVDDMLAGGLLEEAERVGAGAVAADAVGYPQALAYLGGRATRAELSALLRRATRRYAKRQKTWFRSEPRAEWVTPEQARERAGAALERMASRTT